jgi:hypothetical protein
MAKVGGYRPEGGRRPGSKDTVKRTRSPNKPKTEAVILREAKGGDESALEYCQRVMNDQAADIGRRDRMASLLLSVEVRTGQVPVIGKKARADVAGQTAGEGTSWASLLDEDRPPVGGSKWSEFVHDSDQTTRGN